jgi:hypothetical protein
MPSAADLTYLLVLVGPGFVAMQARAWTSEESRMSDAQRFTWSLLIALPIFFGLYALVRVSPVKFGQIDGPATLLSQPFSAPYVFVLALYVIAAVAGWSIGRLQDANYPKILPLLKLAKLDPTKHRDVWRAAMKTPNTVAYIHLNDGTEFYGWPDEHTSGLYEATRFLRLTHASRRPKIGDPWKELPREDFILLCTDTIKYIHFKPYVPRDSKPDRLEGTASAESALYETSAATPTAAI